MEFFVEKTALIVAGGGPNSAINTQVPAGQRRRLSGFAKMTIEALLQVSDELHDSPDVVLATQHGDFQRTIRLLRYVAASHELSPTQFCLSVNNAVLGQFSLFTDNRASMSTVSAGPLSLAYGFLEAYLVLQQQPHKTVLLVYSDEPLIDEYQHFCQQPQQAVSMAWCLRSAATASATAVNLQLQHQPEAHAEDDIDRLALTEQLQALVNGRSASVTAMANRQRWIWSRADA